MPTNGRKLGLIIYLQRSGHKMSEYQGVTLTCVKQIRRYAFDKTMGIWWHLRGTDTEMNELPRQKLCELIGKYGESLCDNPARCEGLLRDVCPHDRREGR